MILGQTNRKRPYMNLKLDGNVTDTGTGGNTPSNTGVTFTTDQFGRANMAGNWDVDTDNLSWASSVGNTVSSKINNGSTVLYWVKQRTLSIDTQSFIFHQNDNAGERAFLIQNLNYPAFNINGVQLYNSINGTDGATFNVPNLLSYGNWQFCCVKYIDNTTDLTAIVNMDSNSGSGNVSKVWESNTVELRLGARLSIGRGDFGDMSNFRFYDVTLTDGQIKILNNQKGRIKA